MKRFALFLSLLLCASLAAAQTFPTKTVRFISGVTLDASGGGFVFGKR